jgi:predicted dehydrogenase
MNTKKCGFGVIGTGTVGGAWHAHVYNQLPQYRLVAICDLNEERAVSIAKQYGVKSVYTDYHELLNNPEIDPVSIATPDHAH